MSILQQIYGSGIIAIIRGVKAQDTVSIARALQKGGIKAVEITLNSPNALTAIEQVASELGDSLLVGAGTVLDAESARAALFAGAKFIISPNVDPMTIETTKRYGAVSIPGAFTPTEILTAFARGADVIKVFPATTLGPQYIKDVHGPLPHIPLIPTGGINLSNAMAYLQAGAFALGIGGSLIAKGDVNEQYLNTLTETASKYVQVVEQARAAI